MVADSPAGGNGRHEGPARISAATLRQLLAGPSPPILLDVRTASERAIGHIPGDVWIPLDRLGDAAPGLDRSRSIVAYCHHGGRSVEAADLLRKAGHAQVAVLEGGLEEFSRWVDPTIPRYADDARDGLVLRQFPNLATGCLAYLLYDRFSHDAVIVDPGATVDPYVEALRSADLRLKGILETHTHADHLSGHATLHLRTGAPIWVSHRSGAAYAHRELREGESLEFGGQAVRVWETPGHTRDHLTLRVGDRVFTGDTLLPGSCGRTDLADGDPELLWRSLYERLLSLGDETEVFPAHYGLLHGLPPPERYSSTIGFERRTNEALLQPSREEFLKYMREGWPPKPARFDEIVQANLRA